MKQPLSIVDCNNFWSPSGGGVRRYHLEKMAFYEARPDVRYTFVMHDKHSGTEQIGENAFIEHLPVPKVPGNWEYRYMLYGRKLSRLLRKIDPDIVEVGSPYFMPGIVNGIVRRHRLKASVFGFWHADFPVTYVKRFLEPMGILARWGEQLAWAHARKQYNQMTGTMVSSQIIQKRMEQNGLRNVYYVPLGVDTRLFHPGKRDEELVDHYKQGDPDRLLLFFPHRFSKEKGLHLLLEAYPKMCKLLKKDPVLVIAGTGPYEQSVRQAAEQYEHVHFIGFIKDKAQMARHYASADLGFALSAWETFGLSLLESLSAGLPLVAAPDGAALEQIQNSGGGILLSHLTSDDIAHAVVQFAQQSGRDSMKNNARKYAGQLTWQHCFEQQIEVYKSGLE